VKKGHMSQTTLVVNDRLLTTARHCRPFSIAPAGDNKKAKEGITGK
jgi:hypothetical protein